MGTIAKGWYISIKGGYNIAKGWYIGIKGGYNSEGLAHTVFTRNDTMGSINFTVVEGGDNSSYAGSEAREVFINTSSGNSGVNK